MMRKYRHITNIENEREDIFTDFIDIKRLVREIMKYFMSVNLITWMKWTDFLEDRKCQTYSVRNRLFE